MTRKWPWLMAIAVVFLALLVGGFDMSPAFANYPNPVAVTTNDLWVEFVADTSPPISAFAVYPNPLTFVSVNSGSGYGNYTYGINVVECTLAGECSDCAEISSVWNVQASSSLAIMTGTAASCGVSPRLVRPACLASSSDADDYTMMATMPVDKPENTRTIMSARDAMISDPTTCLAAMKIGGYRGEGLGSGNVRASPIYCGAKIGGCYGGGLRGPGPASLIDGLPVGVVNKETTIAAPPFSSKTARWA